MESIPLLLLWQRTFLPWTLVACINSQTADFTNRFTKDGMEPRIPGCICLPGSIAISTGLSREWNAYAKIDVQIDGIAPR
jgi:hypothetical protein